MCSNVNECCVVKCLQEGSGDAILNHYLGVLHSSASQHEVVDKALSLFVKCEANPGHADRPFGIFCTKVEHNVCDVQSEEAQSLLSGTSLNGIDFKQFDLFICDKSTYTSLWKYLKLLDSCAYHGSASLYLYVYDGISRLVWSIEQPTFNNCHGDHLNSFGKLWFLVPTSSSSLIVSLVEQQSHFYLGVMECLRSDSTNVCNMHSQTSHFVRTAVHLIFVDQEELTFVCNMKTILRHQIPEVARYVKEVRILGGLTSSRHLVHQVESEVAEIFSFFSEVSNNKQEGLTFSGQSASSNSCVLQEGFHDRHMFGTSDGLQGTICSPEVIQKVFQSVVLNLGVIEKGMNLHSDEHFKVDEVEAREINFQEVKEDFSYDVTQQLLHNIGNGLNHCHSINIEKSDVPSTMEHTLPCAALPSSDPRPPTPFTPVLLNDPSSINIDPILLLECPLCTSTFRSCKDRFGALLRHVHRKHRNLEWKVLPELRTKYPVLVEYMKKKKKRHPLLVHQVIQNPASVVLQKNVLCMG